MPSTTVKHLDSGWLQQPGLRAGGFNPQVRLAQSDPVDTAPLPVQIGNLRRFAGAPAQPPVHTCQVKAAITVMQGQVCKIKLQPIKFTLPPVQVTADLPCSIQCTEHGAREPGAKIGGVERRRHAFLQFNL
jgi:hypothetical protein